MRVSARRILNASTSILAFIAVGVAVAMFISRLAPDSGTVGSLVIGVLAALVGGASAILLSVMTARRPKLEVFLSFASGDRLPARWIADELRSRNIRTHSMDEVPVGQSISGAVLRQLDLVDYVVILLSKSSAKSPWIAREIELARAKGKRVLPVLLEETELPPELEDLRYVDFTKDRDKASELLVRSMIAGLKSDGAEVAERSN